MLLDNIKIWCCSVTQYTNYKLHLQTKNRMMHPTGCSLYLTFDIFDTILYKCLNTIMHIWKEINRINQIEVNKSNKDCMAGVNALTELFYFTHTLYIDLKSREECFISFRFCCSNGLISSIMSTKISPSHDIAYGFGSQQFNDIPLRETNNMPSKFFISNRFLVGECWALIALNPHSYRQLMK